MDHDTPLVVGQNTLITSVASGSFAAVYALFKGYPLGPLTIQGGINGGIAGATFFSIREYVVNTVILAVLPPTSHYRQIREFYKRPPSLRNAEKLSFWDMRAHQTPESAIGGALAGAMLNAMKRGPKGVATGLSTGAIVCSSLQLLYNEAGIARIKFVTKRLQASQDAPSLQPISSEQSAQASIAELQKPVIDRLLNMLGFHQVSDEEYLRRLKAKRDGYLLRIAELERAGEQQKELELAQPLQEIKSA